jgi:hypothetical protein
MDALRKAPASWVPSARRVALARPGPASRSCAAKQAQTVAQRPARNAASLREIAKNCRQQRRCSPEAPTSPVRVRLAHGPGRPALLARDDFPTDLCLTPNVCERRREPGRYGHSEYGSFPKRLPQRRGCSAPTVLLASNHCGFNDGGGAVHANGFDLQIARDREAELLKLAAPAKILPPRRLAGRSRLVWVLLRRRRRDVRATLNGVPSAT